MTVVKELNELAYKMTGTNPKAKTDQQALNFIEQHYEGGQPSPTPQSNYDYIIPAGLYQDVSGEITNEDIIAVLEEIKNNYRDENGEIKNLKIGVHIGNNDQGDDGANYMTNVIAISGNPRINSFDMQFFCNCDFLSYNGIYYSKNKWYLSSFQVE